MLKGELNYRQENYEVGFKHLRISVEKYDNLPYVIFIQIKKKNKKIIFFFKKNFRMNHGDGWYYFIKKIIIKKIYIKQVPSR